MKKSRFFRLDLSIQNDNRFSEHGFTKINKENLWISKDFLELPAAIVLKTFRFRFPVFNSKIKWKMRNSYSV